MLKRGFETTLISGPTNLEINKDINLIKVETAEDNGIGKSFNHGFEGKSFLVFKINTMLPK